MGDGGGEGLDLVWRGLEWVVREFRCFLGEEMSGF